VILCYDTKTTIFINNIKLNTYISLDILLFLIFLFNNSFLGVSLKVLLSLDFKVSLIVSFIVLLLKIELYE
jgi:hypothetical protein